MTPTLAVKTRLLQVSAVTALISQRVYADVLPQGVDLPAIRLERIDAIDALHLRGTKAMVRARVQVNAIALTKADARAVLDAVEGGADGTSLSGWTGTLSGSPSTFVMGVTPAGGEVSDYSADELRQYRESKDYFISMRG